MKLKISKTVVLRILTFISIFLLVMIGRFFYRRTLIDWWMPVMVALVIAVLTSSFSAKWQWLSQMDNRIVNYLYHLACIGSICYVLFLGANYLLSDAGSTHLENVIVQNKYIDVHKSKSRRGSSHTSRTYHLQLVFENGWAKNISVSQSIYNKTRVGNVKVMTLRKGFLGFPVVNKGI